MSDVQEIFDTHKCISKAWLDKVFSFNVITARQIFTNLQKVAARYGSEGLGSFLKLAFNTSPHLFSSNPRSQDEELMEVIPVVFLAWKRLRKMRASNERWSEADYVASVYVSPSHYSTSDASILTIVSGTMSFGVLPSGIVFSG